MAALENGMASQPTSSAVADDEGIEILSLEEGRAFFDEMARERLGISGDEFVRRWHAGEWRDDHRSEILELVIMLPFAGA